MNKTTKFFAAFAAVALMSACSSEEPVVNGGEEGGAGNGQKAYLAVTINSTGDMGMGRSTDYETPVYEDGAEFEHKVDWAGFFFFDEQGNYVLRASVADPSFGEDNPVNDNIEYMSTKNVLVLEDLKGNEYPTYMLTVLNMEGFAAEATLEATTKKLSIYAQNFKVENGENVQNFVMSTSAYYDENNNHDNKFYNVTKLHKSNFKLTADEAQNNSPVDVYVERLAAKVQLTVDAPVETINGKEYFVLEQTIAGGGNDNGTPEDGLANTKVYLEVEGWSLNATAIDSYVGKQLKADWATTNPFTSWQAVDRYRSFWAYSKAYAEGGANPDAHLNYTNLPAVKTPASLDYAEYCYENTNAAENIFKKNSAGQNLVVNSKVTHAILKTKVYNAAGEVQNLVEYRGVPYYEETFKAYLLNSFKNSSKGLNYYYLTGSKPEGEATVTDYVQVDVKDIAFELKQGYEEVNIVLADATKALYKKTTNADGETEFVKLEGEDNDLATRLAAFQGDTPLIWHNQGTNIYFIPVEHNATAANKDKEGYYGVVRNHWYRLTVNSFSKLGHGAYDPDDATIIIKPDTPEDPRYYVGAKINILSWRIISQSVDL